MGFRPQPDEEKSLIKYDPENVKSYQKYVDAMEAYLTNPLGQAIGIHVGVNYFEGQDDDKFQQCSEESHFEGNKNVWNV